ncbi:DUF2878 domain-containing protein [Bacterioplanoides pacificum]|uniref:DUF2878 domain-containing protein n=1 Tax=Bacterioplanoides pacificum TaxID=1171596 RepID=A0ABV7VWF3_9GAMM
MSWSNVFSRPTPWLKTVINALLFQACWLACVIGGDPWAFAALLLLLVVHAGWLLTRQEFSRELVIVLPVISAGIAFDTLLLHVGWLSFADHNSAVIPFWLMVLWLAFACTLRHSLAGLIRRRWLALLLGGLGAPWSYYLGDKLGAVNATTEGLIAIGLFWGALLLWVCAQLRRPVLNNPGETL